MTLLANPYRCNHCGKLREKDTNHWWLLWWHSLAAGSSVRWLRLEPWSAKKAKQHSATHACGQECALKLIERWMQTGSFDPPSSKPISTGKEMQ